jgi:hypothetical protein
MQIIKSSTEYLNDVYRGSTFFSEYIYVLGKYLSIGQINS